VPGPMDCFLTMRGVKTLGVRMDRHCSNAAAVVEFLAGHAAVKRVLWPGLADHPGHDVAVKQMRHFGGMVSFTIHGGAEAAAGLVERTQVITLAESLGGVESLIEVPALMTHLSVAGSTNEVDPGLVRLSVGIETVDDIIGDLGQALHGLAAG
jgi:cystathionine gamma-synthase